MVQWMPMRKAAQLLGKSHPTISRLAALHVIKTKNDKTDRRVKLVDLDELRKLYSVQSTEE